MDTPLFVIFSHFVCSIIQLSSSSQMLRIIKEAKPKFFITENVKGILSLEKGKVLEMIIKDFESLGYNVDYKLLNATEYGVPQCRERVIIIRNNIGVENKFPTKTHTSKKENNLKKAITTKETIGFLYNVPLNKNNFLLNETMIYNHIARIMNK